MSDNDARAEAERRYASRDRYGLMNDGIKVGAFVAGAEWQASRTPVVADVDAIARVLGEHLPVAGIREGWCGAEGCEYRTVNRNGWTTHQAEQVAALLRGA